MKNFEELLQFIDMHEEDWKTRLLHAPFNLKCVKQCLYNKNWYCVMYNLFDSIFDNSFEGRVVRECRGTIIEKISGKPAKIICAPYTKFFNYGEDNAALIDWNSAIIREKIDGWLIKCAVVEDENRKHKAIWFSNGAFLDIIEPGEVDSTIEVNGQKCSTINQVLYIALNHAEPLPFIYNDSCFSTASKWLNNVPVGTTLMFELTSAWTKICTVYDKEPKLWLHGVRLNSGDEISPEDAKSQWNLPFDIPQQFKYNFGKAEDIQEFMQNWSGKEHEGVVVCDKYFNRIKIKCEDYLKAKYISDYADILSKPKNLWKYCINGEADDIIANLPMLQDSFNLMNNDIKNFKSLYMQIVSQCHILFNECNNDKKIFAFKIANLDRHLKTIYFQHSKSESESQDIDIFNKTIKLWAYKKDGYETFEEYKEAFNKNLKDSI